MKVYIKTDAENRIIAVNSATWINDFSGWTEIDEGEGDRYNHAQGNYFSLPLTDEYGVYRYKLSDGSAVERTAEEMDADRAAIEPEPDSTEDIMLDMLADHEYRLGMIELGL